LRIYRSSLADSTRQKKTLVGFQIECCSIQILRPSSCSRSIPFCNEIIEGLLRAHERKVIWKASLERAWKWNEDLWRFLNDTQRTRSLAKVSLISRVRLISEKKKLLFYGFKFGSLKSVWFWSEKIFKILIKMKNNNFVYFYNNFIINKFKKMMN
jgi:hypothetical protein